MKKRVMGKGMLILDRGNVDTGWRRWVEGARMKSEEEVKCSVDKSGREGEVVMKEKERDM